MHTATLVSITPDAEELIAYCARVSNPANQNNTQTASRLLKYLIKHRHWSPFEMANMVVEIKTNRAIAAQILRHRSFSFQEFSQRYAEVQSIPTPPYLRRQDTKKSQDVYQRMLKQGIAKECAREVLPIGSDTTLYMNGTIRSWLHYIDLRASPETQLEHRRIAEGCKMLINDTMPDVYEAMWK